MSKLKLYYDEEDGAFELRKHDEDYENKIYVDTVDLAFEKDYHELYYPNSSDEEDYTSKDLIFIPRKFISFIHFYDKDDRNNFTSWLALCAPHLVPKSFRITNNVKDKT